MDIKIKKTALEDNAQIASIVIQCWQDAYKDIFPKDFLDNLSIEKRLEQRLSWFGADNRFSLIAYTQDKIIGFCDFGEARRPQFAKGEIYSLYVLSEYKGYGIGKSLMQEAMKQLQSYNLSPFIVTTLEANLPARKFYEKLEFKEIGQIMTEVGDRLYPEVVYILS